MTDEQLTLAQAEQAEAIARMVNAAYRPDPGRGGWTHEAALVEGPRIDEAQVLRAMRRPGTAILVARSDAGILACVQLEQAGDVCLLGLLAVAPGHQGSGLGRRLMEHAERHAFQQMACARIRITVLSQRPELISFYVRRGFRPTGTVTGYPYASGVGTPIVEGLTLDTFEKILSPDIPTSRNTRCITC